MGIENRLGKEGWRWEKNGSWVREKIREGPGGE